MDLLLIGTAFLFAFLAVIVWQSVRSGPLTGLELRRRINALHHDNIGHQPAGPSAWAPRMVERCRFLMIRRGRSVRTGGFTGLGITLLALLVWVGGRYVPPSHDLEPVQVPATVVSGSLTTVDPTAAEPDPARLARGAAVLDRGTAVLEQGVGTRLVPEVLVPTMPRHRAYRSLVPVWGLTSRIENSSDGRTASRSAREPRFGRT